jgi:hypothetical protein
MAFPIIVAILRLQRIALKVVKIKKLHAAVTVSFCSIEMKSLLSIVENISKILR